MNRCKLLSLVLSNKTHCFSPQSLAAVCTHGAFLMQNSPTRTAELLDSLCSDPSGFVIFCIHSESDFVKNIGSF